MPCWPDRVGDEWEAAGADPGCIFEGYNIFTHGDVVMVLLWKPTKIKYDNIKEIRIKKKGEKKITTYRNAQSLNKIIAMNHHKFC